MADLTPEGIMALVALLISLIAFGLSILQSVLAYLQFDNSEGGRRRCSEEVMGKGWAAKTERKYKWGEFRYQVFFEVPVFYTAPPDITVGPLTLPKPEIKDKGRAPKGVDAEREPADRIDRDAIRKMEVITVQPHVAPIYKITGSRTSCKHTMTEYTSGTDEKWARVHTAEDEGCSWILLLDALQGQEGMSRKWDRPNNSHAIGHTICYLIQRKRRCWDYMPLNATKPFATTTIAHLVEMMSMLGMVWTDFDVKASTLSAEGNGYMIKSENMSGLGIIARFARLGRPRHEGNRIIPCIEVKKLCFGQVPSLFDFMGQPLQVSPRRIEGCLAVLLPGLTSSERKSFKPKDFIKKTVLPTPTLELIAMTAKSCHIPGSRFRRLPNPCGDAPSAAVNAAACLQQLGAFVKKLAHLESDPLAKEISNAFTYGRFYGLNAIDRGGRPLDELVKNFLAAESGLQKTVGASAPAAQQQQQQDGARSPEELYNGAHVALMDALHAASERIGERLGRDDLQEELRGVLAAHLSAVLAQRGGLQAQLARSADVERDLVAFYFESVRPAVVRPGALSATTSTSGTATSDQGVLLLGPLSPAEAQTSAVWLALMFRMWSWMVLHEFNPLDKMIERTEFLDSRLPVYIG